MYCSFSLGQEGHTFKRSILQIDAAGVLRYNLPMKKILCLVVLLAVIGFGLYAGPEKKHHIGIGFYGSIVSKYTESPTGGEPAIWGTLKTLDPYISGRFQLAEWFSIDAYYQQGFILAQDMFFFSPDTYTEIGGHTETIRLLGVFHIIPGDYIDFNAGLGASFMHVLKTFNSFVEGGNLVTLDSVGYFRMLYPSPLLYLETILKPIPFLYIGMDAYGFPWAMIFNTVENMDGTSTEKKSGFDISFRGYLSVLPSDVFRFSAGYKYEIHHFRAPAPGEVDLKLNLSGPFLEVMFSF